MNVSESSDSAVTNPSLDSSETSGMVNSISISTLPPSREDVIETITDTFLSAISKDINETQNRKKDFIRSSAGKIEAFSAELTSFGKIATEDPISALLSNIEIVDVRNYIPRGYRFSNNNENDLDEGNEVMMKEFGQNINDLLDDKKFRNKRLKLIPKRKKENMKPGNHAEIKMSKAEDDIYQVTVEGPTHIKKKTSFGWTDFDDETQEQDLVGREADLLYSEFFGSLLEESRGFQHGSLSGHLEETRPTTATTTTLKEPKETTSATTTTTTLFAVECGTFCSLHGNVVIIEGLEWNTKLLHEVTENFKLNKNKFERQCSKIFKHVYFGAAFEFCSLQSFAKTSNGVKVLFSLQFNGLIFKITSKDIYKAFRDYMEYNHESNMMGDYKVDAESAFFLVVDSDLSDGTFGQKFAKYGVELPDWAWLVVIAGIVCILIVAVLGISIGLQRHKQNIAVKRTLINSKALKSVRSPDAFDMVQLGKYFRHSTLVTINFLFIQS